MTAARAVHEGRQGVAANRPAGGRVIVADEPRLESISAVTLFTGDMARAVAFYRALGFRTWHGGPQAAFTSLGVGAGFLNLMAANPAESPWLEQAGPARHWGRIVLHVSDVDAMHARACAAGLSPETAPADAPWGERFFHLRDPDGHELAFARPLSGAGTRGRRST